MIDNDQYQIEGYNLMLIKNLMNSSIFIWMHFDRLQSTYIELKVNSSLISQNQYQINSINIDQTNLSILISRNLEFNMILRSIELIRYNGKTALDMKDVGCEERGRL